MNRYLRGFIHDVRTAIGIIVQCCDPGVVQDPNVKHMDMIRNHASRALVLITEFENRADTEEDRQAAMPVTSLRLKEFLQEFPVMYPKVKVRYDCAEYGEVLVDLTLLQRVLDNCIQNSLRAGKSEWVLLTCDSDEEVLNLHVKDGGVGMDKRQLERIGLGFSTTGGGNGTKILIELLTKAGGVIRWNSIPDVGTCATITFKLINGKHK